MMLMTLEQQNVETKIKQFSEMQIHKSAVC